MSDKEPERFFYSNARLSGKTALLAGPFVDEHTAAKIADLIKANVILDRPEAEFATFGSMSVTQHIGYGLYNYLLRGTGIPVLSSPTGPPPEKFDS